MSAKKRRIKRKLRMLARMDKTYIALYITTSPRRDPERAWPFWWVVAALGDAMTRRYGPNKGWLSICNTPTEKAVLMARYIERNPGAAL